MAGQFILPTAVASKLAAKLSQVSIGQRETSPENKVVELTEREREIAALIIKGYNNREIASELFLADGTARNYISNLYSKLNVIDRVQAIACLQRLL
ncbi:Spore germination protein GerE [compost metagenome]